MKTIKIVQISVYQVLLPMTKTIWLSGGRSYQSLDSTIVSMTTSDGMTGWGESCPYGANYLPGYAQGVRCGIKELAPHLIGLNPIQIDYINHIMDKELVGHFYLKSAIDMALWDLLGKKCGMSICDLMGGRWKSGTDVQVAISASDNLDDTIREITDWRKKGIHKFSIKLSGEPKADAFRVREIIEIADPMDDYVFDANQSYTVADGLRAMQAVRDLNFMLEQPCSTYEECRAVHLKIAQPMVLDECIYSLKTLMRAIQDRSTEALNIKIAKVGGLTKARKIRDVCADAGILICIQDTGGSDIAKAAVAHLAESTPMPVRHSLWDCKDAIEIKTASGLDDSVDGRLHAPSGPGLGVSVIPEVIGEPVAVFD